MKSPITEKARKDIESQKATIEKLREVIRKLHEKDGTIKQPVALSENDIELVEAALMCYAGVLNTDAAQREGAIECGSEDGNLKSHSEKDIWKGCLALMHGLLEDVQRWLLFVDINPNDYEGEEKFCYSASCFTMVQRLFLWNTTHSGGTSTMAKMRELGITKESEVFEFDPEINEYDCYW